MPANTAQLQALNDSLEAARKLVDASRGLARGYGVFRRASGTQDVAYAQRGINEDRMTQITLVMTAEGKFGAQVRTLEVCDMANLFRRGPRVLASSPAPSGAELFTTLPEALAHGLAIAAQQEGVAA